VGSLRVLTRVSLLDFSAPHGGGRGGGALRHAGAVPRLPPRRRRGVLRARVHGRGKFPSSSRALPFPCLIPENWASIWRGFWG